MYIHPKLRAFEKQLDALFHAIDGILEDHWGHCFPLHPNRPARGTTENPEMDGLFEIAPDFTPGLGSERGKGYIVSLRVATLAKVTPDEYEGFMDEAAKLLKEKLPLYFPDRDLEVVRDGKRFKIIGDFSLGQA